MSKKELVVGECIKSTDEKYIYQIQRIDEFGYHCVSIGHGHTRSFAQRATHYQEATDEEIQYELKTAPKHFPFWVANKRNEIISNGYVYAIDLELAKEIFRCRLSEMRNVGEYCMSETPASYYQNPHLRDGEKEADND